MKILSLLILLFLVASCGGGAPAKVKPTSPVSPAAPVAELEKIKLESVEEVQIPEDTQAYLPKNISSEKNGDVLVTQKLQLESVKAEIKDSILEITAVAANIPGKPLLHLKGAVDSAGRFVLNSKDHFDDFNVVGVGECALEITDGQISRCQSFYADIYLRTLTEVFSRQLSLDKIAYKDKTSTDVVKVEDKCDAEHEEFCGKRSEFVGIPIKLENIPAPLPKATVGSVAPSAPVVEALPLEIFKTAQKVLRQAFGFYYTTYDKDGRPIYGRLENAATLTASDDFIKTNVQRGADFGTNSLVNLVKAVNEHIALQAVGVKPTVGNLSMKNGGKMPCVSKDSSRCHSSHQNGLDVDLGYILSTNQARGFEVIVQQKSLSPAFKIKENWELLKWINKNSKLNRVFVHPLIKKSFCEHARKNGEFETEKETLTKVVADKDHYDHFHVRLECPKEDSQCRNQEAAKNLGC